MKTSRGSLIEVNPWKPAPRQLTQKQIAVRLIIVAFLVGHFVPGLIHLGYQVFDGPVDPIPPFDWWWMWIFSK